MCDPLPGGAGRVLRPTPLRTRSFRVPRLAPARSAAGLGGGRWRPDEPARSAGGRICAGASPRRPAGPAAVPSWWARCPALVLPAGAGPCALHARSERVGCVARGLRQRHGRAGVRRRMRAPDRRGAGAPRHPPSLRTARQGKRVPGRQSDGHAAQWRQRAIGLGGWGILPSDACTPRSWPSDRRDSTQDRSYRLPPVENR